jgi:hydrogenase expression/formation protein HypC
MCLAIPGRVKKINIEEQNALIDYNGVIKKASTMLMPQTAVNDFVLVHAGFIIQIIDEEYGKDLSKLTEELGLV